MANEQEGKVPEIHKGLVGVYVDKSTICYIDEDHSRLYYRGYSIDMLCEKSTFEEVAFLILFGRLPTAMELISFKERLVNERDIPDRILMILKSFPRNTTRIELLRTAISGLSLYDEEGYDYSEIANLNKGIRIIAKIPTILAYSHRIKGNVPLVEPKKDINVSHAANFYYMMTGKMPTPEIERAFDLALIIQAEHDLNASTFAARLTVSTLSDIYSAVVSAIGTLRGPLHGGANERVIEMLREIATKDKVIPYVEERLNRKEKIFGFGHRIYKGPDPRAEILKKQSKLFWDKEAPNHAVHDNLHEMAVMMEEYMLKTKNLYPNVDFYSGPLLHALGVPSPLFTPLFATCRSVGWIAHAIEQLRDNKLIRPRLYYTGEYEKEYIPIDKR